MAQVAPAMAFYQAQASLIPLVSNHQFIGKPVQCPKNMPIWDAIRQRQHHRGTSDPTTTNLHHEPVYRCIHLQLTIKDQDVEDGHPAKEADFKES